MTQNTYSVYKHTAPSGKIYIGITSRKVEARWHKDGSGYKYAGSFRDAITEFGWENIQHEVLATGLSGDEARAMEIALIAAHRATDPAYGYNRSLGGGLGWAGMTHTAEAKRKIRESKIGERNPMYGTHLSAEHREAVSKANRGKSKTAETRARMSAAQQARSEETRKKLSEAQKKKAVLCAETGTVYASVSEAAHETGIHVSNIVRCCKGRGKSAGGFHWSYADELAS